MKLSILLQGRNDNYKGNFKKRLEMCLEKHADNINKLDLLNEIEIVLTDWGSNQPLINELKLSISTKSLIRSIYVTENIAKKYEGDSPYSMPHAVNAGIRRCKGDYVIFTDSDGYMPLESLASIMKIINKGNNSTTLFLAGRKDIPYIFHKNADDFSLIDEYLQNNRHIEVEAMFDEKGNFRGTAMAYFASKKVFEDLRGFDENMIYWGFFDIDFYYRALMKYKFENLMDYGIEMYHLEHYENKNERTKFNGNDYRKLNSPVYPKLLTINKNNWGLINELIYEGRFCTGAEPDDDLPLTIYEIKKNAEQLFNNKEIDSAFDLIIPVIKENPNYFDAVILLSKIYLAKGDKNTSLNLANFVLKYDRYNHEALDIINGINGAS